MEEGDDAEVLHHRAHDGTGEHHDAAEATTTTEAPRATSATIRPLFTRGDEGGVGTEVVRLGPSPDGSLRVDFSEDEVSGLGDQSRAASWSAVTVATLLSGAPLEGRYEFEISGPIDGPSAGALKTVAVLSLLRGEALDADVTMTGTVNPDGTVGPVGGIPEKVLGAAEEGIDTVLIPVGQRNSISKSTGELVDVVDLGRREGVEVVEVTDVYQAYTELTGEALPRLEAGGDTKLDAKAYDRLKAQADSFLASFNQSAGVFASLDPTIQEMLADLALEAQAQADRSADLARQGLQAGAFSAATQAAALADAAAVSGQAVQILLTQGIDPFLARVGSSQAIEGEVYALFDTLKTFEPRTVSDAASLMSPTPSPSTPCRSPSSPPTSSTPSSTTSATATSRWTRPWASCSSPRCSSRSPAPASTWPRPSSRSVVTSAGRPSAPTSTSPSRPTSSARAPTPTSPPSRARW